jgi:hypothetical protein
MSALQKFLKHEGLVFQSKQGASLAETTILSQGLYPVLKSLGLRKAGMHSDAVVTDVGSWGESQELSFVSKWGTHRRITLHR